MRDRGGGIGAGGRVTRGAGAVRAELPALAQGLLDASRDAVALLDRTGRLIGCNRVMEMMFGCPRDQLGGRPFDALVPGALAAPDGTPRELVGHRADGGEFPVEASVTPIDAEGDRLAACVLRDVTRQRQADAEFRSLLESAPDGIVVVDRSGTIALVNGQTEAMFGYPRSELVGRPVEILVPEQFQGGHVAHRHDYFAAPRTRPMGAGQMLAGRRRDGSEFPVEISLSLLDTARGTLVTAIVRDMTDRRDAEDLIRASLREKEVLLKEIHHRVKNNLQVTSSLLRLQSARIDDPIALEMFAVSQDRLRSMALVHEKLYQSRDLSRIDFADYAGSLARLLFGTFGVDPDRIRLVVAGSPVLVPVDVAVPCGLILSELVSNCLKHGFPRGRSGRIEIRTTGDGDRLMRLSVADDGVGLPPDVDLDSAETLGLELVRTLAEQLAAEVVVLRDGGTRVELLVPRGVR